MQINGIKTLDYKADGDDVFLTLANTTLEDILTLDGQPLRVETDSGELVEALGSRAITNVLYMASEQSFQAVLTSKPPDVAVKMEEMSEQLNDIMAALTELACMVDAVTAGGEANG